MFRSLVVRACRLRCSSLWNSYRVSVNRFSTDPVGQSDSPSFRITYYGFSGRAGPLRLAAYYGGIAFEDNFITFDEQTKDKQEGRRKWSGPPEITIYDKNGNDLATIGQSNACLRYIGIKYI